MSRKDGSDVTIISSYTLKQAILDGVVVEVFKNRWLKLSRGKPIVATRHVFEKITMAGIIEIWNEYAYWRKNVCPTLPEEEQMFSTKMNGEDVWVIEDGDAFTVLFPEDY